LYFILALLLVPIFYLAVRGAPGTFPPVMIVLIPFMYAIVGYIGTAIGCWLYNIVAGWSGGIAFTLEPAEGAETGAER
jgi:hypothetical protein